jgi:hypothetical protein
MVEINVNIKADNAAEYLDTLRSLIGDNANVAGLSVTNCVIDGTIPAYSAKQIQESFNKPVEQEKHTRSRSNKTAESKKVDPEPTSAPEPTSEAAPISAEVRETEPAADPKAEPEVTTYSIEQVRDKLKSIVLNEPDDKKKKEKQAKVHALVATYGVEKLTQVPAEKYGELMTAAAELG